MHLRPNYDKNRWIIVRIKEYHGIMVEAQKWIYIFKVALKQYYSWMLVITVIHKLYPFGLCLKINRNDPKGNVSIEEECYVTQQQQHWLFMIHKDSNCSMNLHNHFILKSMVHNMIHFNTTSSSVDWNAQNLESTRWFERFILFTEFPWRMTLMKLVFWEHKPFNWSWR